MNPIVPVNVENILICIQHLTRFQVFSLSPFHELTFKIMLKLVILCHKTPAPFHVRSPFFRDLGIMKCLFLPR